ncbi:uncharacterized protein [Eurosta solidaginis]|uniref:uncharacterized protein n=1 Tax=Eurosta solidaginis TaxID=178769 RepID=UPI003530E1B8
MKGMKRRFLTKAAQKEMLGNLEENSQLQAKCSKIEFHNEEQTKFMNDQRTDIADIKTILSQQLELLKELKTEILAIKQKMATQDVVIEKLMKRVLPNTSNLTILPFKTIEEIKSSDKILSQYSRDELVAYVRTTVGVTPIRKIVPFVFAESTLPFINWDGRQQKFPIKSLKFFNEIVFRSVHGPDMDCERGSDPRKTKCIKANPTSNIFFCNTYICKLN